MIKAFFKLPTLLTDNFPAEFLWQTILATAVIIFFLKYIKSHIQELAEFLSLSLFYFNVTYRLSFQAR